MDLTLGTPDLLNGFEGRFIGDTGSVKHTMNCSKGSNGLINDRLHTSLISHICLEYQHLRSQCFQILDVSDLLACAIIGCMVL